MPINVYTGLMGSGKSYEVVSSVILDAVAAGRSIVTNVDGIDGDAIRAYVSEHRGIPLDRLGHVRHCSNDDVGRSDFFPYGTDVDTFCKPGEMVCIDEAWRFWGGDCKLLPEHKIFFREHRHYVDARTKVACDLVLMVQDITDLHRVLRVVVELTFRTTKIKSLGLSKMYRVEMWEGYKLTRKGRVAVESKTYDKRIFPLYSSYSGGAGKELQVDARQNILRNPWLWVVAVLVVVMFVVSVYFIRRFFHPSQTSKPLAPSAPVSGGSSSSPVPASSPRTQSSAVSDVWRVAGELRIGLSRYILIADTSGRIRYESPSMFSAVGPDMVGEIDGLRVTRYSGVASSGVFPLEPKK